MESHGNSWNLLERSVCSNTNVSRASRKQAAVIRVQDLERQLSNEPAAPRSFRSRLSSWLFRIKKYSLPTSNESSDDNGSDSNNITASYSHFAQSQITTVDGTKTRATTNDDGKMARWQPTTLYLPPSLQFLAERQTLMGLTTMYPSKTMATLRPTTLYPPPNLQVLLSEHYPPSRRRPTKAHSLMLSTPKPQTSTWLLTSKLQDFWLFIGLFSTVGRAPSTASTQFIQFSRFHAPVQHGLVSKKNGTTILMTADSKEMHWMGSNSLLVLFAWWV